MSLKGEEALILGMDYTEESLLGAGALKGQDGKDGVSPVISVNTSTADTYKLDITDKNGTITTPNLVGKQGLQGIQGEQGKPADNPIITENADNTEDVYKLDLTVGETVFTTKNIIGKQGLEGVSPSVTTNPDNTAEDYRLNITTKGGTFTTPNLRGPIGPQGEQGESAASAINPRGDYDVNADPHYTVSDYITSSEGNTYVCKKDNPDNVAPTDGTVNDEFWQVLALRGAKGEAGKDGEKGADGVTFTPSIDENGVLSFTNNGGLENPEPVNVKGVNGTTFTPIIDADGYLSFTNDGNLENPEPIKVLGKDGLNGTDGQDGTTYIPSIGTVTTVESNADASAGVTVDEETKEAIFHFEIPKGASGEKAVQFTPSITENGELAWENDGDLENPPTTPIQTLISTAPLGTVLSFAGSTAPNGYLLCDGKSYAVADYEDLYAVIGNTYGGDTENFNVPNLVDKFIQGSTTSGTEKEAGLPNITGDVGVLWGGANGAFTNRAYDNVATTSSGYNRFTVSLDASRSNAIYGNSDTVQPPALTMVYIIKAFHTNEGTDSGVSDDVVDYVESEIAEVESKVAKHSLPLVYDTGMFINTSVRVFKLANMIKQNASTNFNNLNLLLSTRRGDEVEIVTGKDDNDYYIQAYRRSNSATKISAMYKDGYDIYIRLELYANFLRVYHKSGVLRDDFAVSEVDAIPDTATEVSIRPLPSIVTTRSLTLNSGYSGYITEVYDPTTKVVVYNVNINGTFKGLGNAIATGFKVPSTATSGADVMVSTIGIYGAVNTSTGDAQFTRLLIRSYGNPYFDVDAQGNYEISGTITYIAT